MKQNLLRVPAEVSLEALLRGSQDLKAHTASDARDVLQSCHIYLGSRIQADLFISS